MSRFLPMVVVRKPEMSPNDLRQCLRAALGGTLGFLVCKMMGWSYGAFFTVSPILLLGMVPVFNAHIVRQYLASTLLVVGCVMVLQGMLGDKPIPMTLVVIALFAGLFRAMSGGVNLLFGAMGVVNLSMLLHFASYPQAHVSDLMGAFVMAVVTTLLICALMHQLLPDPEPRQPRQMPVKPASNVRHEVILATTVATLSFLVFQVLDLQDSLSAQISSILVVFPLSWKGAGPAGWNRALGTLLGCAVGLLVQFVLMNHFDILLLVAFGLWISLLLFARCHMLEGGLPGVGFAGLTTMAILFGQYLTPAQDLFFNDLYRITSLSVAVMLSLMVIFLMDRLLNRFESTRLQPVT